MVAIALFLRVGWILVGHTYKFKSAEENFGFGWEMGRIGAAIASGHGFSNAFGAPTGPTAWEPPLYPYLTAGVFHFFGIYSRASAFVLLSINSVFSALTCIPIFLIARRIFSEKVAVGSAWTWALLPYVMFWCTRWVWETSFSALLLAVIFWLALTMEERDGLKPWLQFGLLWGVAALNSTVLIAFLPASGLWAWYRRAKRHKPSFAGVGAGLRGFHCLCHTLDGAQLSNLRQVYFHPRQLRRGTASGQRPRRRWHLDAVPASHAGHFTRCASTLPWASWPISSTASGRRSITSRPITGALPCSASSVSSISGRDRRGWRNIWWLAEVKNSLFLASSVLMFWGLGRALRQRKPGAWLLFWLILLYPAIYYVVYPGQRYRHPIEPEMVILGVFLLTEAGKKNPASAREMTGNIAGLAFVYPCKQRNPRGPGSHQFPIAASNS